MNLFQRGNFRLSSGIMSAWRIDCDALADEDIATLANLVMRMMYPFASVEGIPRGGIRLAKALLPYRAKTGGHLIVDDVYTTGGSMERARSAYSPSGDTYPAQEGMRGVVLFARGKLPGWIKAVFQAHSELWIER